LGFRDRGIEIKTPDQIEKMRVAGLLTGQTLEVLRDAVRPGVTTGELDAIAEDHIRSGGGVPSFKGYSQPPFPGSICASVNDQVVHGIPGDRVLAEGDVISIDCGAIVDGWHGDAAITVPVGEVPAEVTELMRVTEGSMWAGFAAARLGGRVSDISHAVETYVRERGDYGILEEFTGHGIGTAMHQPPNVPNYGRPGRGPKLERGLALAVEPMVTLGSHHTALDDDEWTVVTEDGSWAAHFEHTFTLTPNGPWVLTALDGGEAMLTGSACRTAATSRACARSCCCRSGPKRPRPSTSTTGSDGRPGWATPTCTACSSRRTSSAGSSSTTGPASCSVAAPSTPATRSRPSPRSSAGSRPSSAPCSTRSWRGTSRSWAPATASGCWAPTSGDRGPQVPRTGGAAVDLAHGRRHGRPLFAGVPREFAAYGGHKEALAGLPDQAVLLAESAACPVQAFRVGRNVYATQFHPELDLAGICTRIEVYRHAGYFEPDQAEVLKARAAEVDVTHPVTLLRNFVTTHAR
jgi:methionyl aminopeptidase